MAKYEDYGLFQSLLGLVLWLQGSASGVSIQQIMERYEVSRRTAERMRNAVAGLFPTEFIETRDGTNKTFKLKSRRLEQVALASFTEDELGSVKIAADLMQKNNMTEKAKLLKSLWEKLISALNLSTAMSFNIEDIMKYEGLAMKPHPRVIMDMKTVSLIREAMMSFHVIKLTYKNLADKIGEYTLIPLGILYGERQHYLVARLAFGPKESPWHYILDRILKVEILNDVFEDDLDFSLDRHASRSFGAFQEDPFEVEWLFSPQAADEARKIIFHPTQTVSVNSDGSLSVKFFAGGRLEMAWHLYTWGDMVTVIKPVDFWKNLPEFWRKD
jgi:predicted DNA-binding transcriptional regulator YafY